MRRGGPTQLQALTSNRREFMCTNRDCPNYEARTTIVAEIKGGLYLWPRLTCAGCGCEPWLMND